MGCFDCTCAITRTSIHVGDEILLVALKPTYKDGFTSKFQGTHDLRSSLNCGNTDIFRFVGVGFYNDYGSIEEFNNDLDETRYWWDYQFMCHLSVVEALLGKAVTDYRDMVYAVKELLNIAHFARIQLMGHNLLGNQYFDRKEIELQKQIIQLTTKMLEIKENTLDEDEKEYLELIDMN